MKRPDSNQILFSEAEALGLKPRWEIGREFLSVEGTGKRHYLSYTRSPFNSQISSGMAMQKQQTHVVLEQAGFPTIPYLRPRNLVEAEAFYDQEQPLVCKPIAGRDMKGVFRVASREDLGLLRYPSKMLLEKYIEGLEVRYLVFRRKVVAVQQKEVRPTSESEFAKWVTNVPEGQWQPELAELAVAVAERMGLGLVAVDFICQPDGVALILEVNSLPGISLFHYPDAGEVINVARLILEAL